MLERSFLAVGFVGKIKKTVIVVACKRDYLMIIKFYVESQNLMVRDEKRS